MRIKIYTLKIFIVFMLQLLSIQLFAQNTITVKGRVLDEERLPLPGVSVKLKGTSVGTVTNINGDYTIKVPGKNGILIFSFVGYKSIEEAINARSAVNVTLSANAQSLNEVVVVAYGTQKKVTVTGALTTVRGEELAKSPSVNLAQTLVGRTSGVSAKQSSGQPGADDVVLRIRGSSTFDTNNQPLVLVDGIERPFNSINAEEVDNITVLKDASTTAVYGIRGANGVILVTTKHGKSGKPSISLTSNYAVQTPTRLPKFVNAYDWAVLYNEALKNDNPSLTADQLKFNAADLQKYQDHSDPIFHPDINWFDYMMNKTAPQSKTTMSVNGGGDLAKYFISFGYTNQGGLWKEFNKQYGYSNNTNYNRYNFRSNIDFNITKSTLFSVSLGGYSDKTHTASNPFGPIQDTPAGASPGLIGDKLILITNVTGRNPLTNISAGYDDRSVSQFNITTDLNQKLDFLIKGLTFRSKLGYDSDYRTLISKDITRATYQPMVVNINGVSTLVYQPLRDEAISGVTAQTFDDRSKRMYLETALQYNQTFGKHNIGALALYNQNKEYWPFSSSYTVQSPNVPIGYLGIVGRLTYNYDLRYLFEASVGRNGSENFPTNTRFGTFPAVSIGWNVTNEPLIKKWLGDSRTLTLLKFTASYGVTGNDKIIATDPKTGALIYERFLYFPSEYNILTNRAQLGEDLKNYEGAVEGKLGNPDITWEKAIKQNYGVEAGLFNNKMNLKFDYFIDNRENIIYQKATIAHVAAAIQDVYNIGKIKNTGVETEINWNDKIGKVQYSFNGNITYAHNKLVDNGRPESPQNQLGYSTNQTFGLVAAGFFNNQAEANAWPLQYASSSTPGDVRYVDSNRDGVVNENDFVAIGYPTFPEISYGANFGLSYKGFDVSVLFQGAGRVSRILANYMQKPANQYGTTLQEVIDQRWTPENAANAQRPKLTATYGNANNYTNSTLWVRDASYLRLKNAEIGYTFSNNFFKKSGIRSARIYVSGQNLITWDKLKIVDPEQEASNNFKYPQLIVFNAGFNVQF